MRKSELEEKMVIEHRNGKRSILLENTFYGLDHVYSSLRIDYRDNLLHRGRHHSDLDIVKVYKNLRGHSLINALSKETNIKLLWKEGDPERYIIVNDLKYELVKEINE